MSDIIKQGFPFPLEKAIDRVWEPGKGWKATRTFEGEEAMIQSLANNYIANAGQFVRVDIKPKPPNLATMTVTFDGVQDGNRPQAEANGDPVADSDSFSLNGADSEKSIWSHSSVSALAEADHAGYQYLRTKVTEAEKDGTWVNRTLRRIGLRAFV